MTYINYEVLDKANIVDPIFKKFDRRLTNASKAWNVRQLYEVQCYAQTTRDRFKAALLQSLSSFEDLDVNEHSYPDIASYCHFAKSLGDPFLNIVVAQGLESVEKLACLILFSEHLITFCDSARLSGPRTTSSDTSDESDEDIPFRMLLSNPDSMEIDLEPIFWDKLSLNQSQHHYDCNTELEFDDSDIIDLVTSSRDDSDVPMAVMDQVDDTRSSRHW
ncbi:hypothetical protein FA15DRAFT_640588 [Coprinopsis marcescibilis]|uniref:Uncharacterized protein n=1 Tax=Coprinopsis marcescibilis TaxID=230819 RepID=A0A5C3KVX5_COPMA|nr:hypothetical protein FA15DRAFT_640588 [Coprinopsis marcescibilis]